MDDVKEYKITISVSFPHYSMKEEADEQACKEQAIELIKAGEFDLKRKLKPKKK